MWAFFLFSLVTITLAYIPDGKESFMSEVFLRELVNRMDPKNLPDFSYMDFPDNRLPLDSRSLDREEEEFFPSDYDSLREAIHPSIRDQELLEHSSLWGNQYVTGGAGEGKQRLKPEGSFKNRQEVKTDATLPAYCNPPNPCPVGYTAAQGCLENFENSASFSRRYQAAQDCMCDTEHMFDCPNTSESLVEDSMDGFNRGFNEMELNRIWQHQNMQINPTFQHKNLVAKKFHQSNKSSQINPFLTGERLPVAAKKGKNVPF